MKTKKPVLYVYFVYYEGDKKKDFKWKKLEKKI